MTDLAKTLTPDERKALADLLGAQAAECRPMSLAMLEGFLTAIVIGPTTVLPSLWIPWVWDHEEGRADPIFDNIDQANRGMGLLMRFMNGIANAFMEEPPSFVPSFPASGGADAEAWREGFRTGTQFSRDDWKSLWTAKPELVAPILGGGKADTELAQSARDAGTAATRSALTAAHAYWLARRRSRSREFAAESPLFGQPRMPVTRSEPKVGRNDPCPCGSGRKFKKCCGMGGGPVLH